MLQYLGTNGSFAHYLISLLLALPVIFLSLSVHESAHAWAALRLGDPSARNLGRISLNPLCHLDPMGFLCMVLFGFGWANPVPIYSRNFKNPRRDMALAALAGPFSNLLLSFLFLLLLRFLGYGLIVPHTYTSEFTFNLATFFLLFLNLGVQLNITLAIFNLLPVPPLDGSRLLYLVLPPKYALKLSQYERYISLAVFLLLLVGPLSAWIGNATDSIVRLMFRLVGIDRRIAFI